MRTVSDRLPETLHKKIKELAEKGSKWSFKNIMDQVPDVDPEEYDKL